MDDAKYLRINRIKGFLRRLAEKESDYYLFETRIK